MFVNILSHKFNAEIFAQVRVNGRPGADLKTVVMGRQGGVILFWGQENGRDRRFGAFRPAHGRPEDVDFA